MTKTRSYGDRVKTNFQGKKYQKKILYMSVINNARFCCQSDQKVLSSNTLQRIETWYKKSKTENFINDDLDPSSSNDETDSDSDNETDNESENDSNNECN